MRVSARLRMENFKTRLLLKRTINGNYEPASMRRWVEKGEPVASACLEHLTHSHLEVWGGQSDARLLYIPGGGFCFGPNDDHRQLLTEIGERLDVQIFLLNYRKAPEHPYPAAFEDTLEAIKNVARGADSLILMADSAGAALALSAQMSMRADGHLPPVKGAVYLSAYTDLANTGLSLVSNSRLDPLFGAEALIHKAHHYLNGHNPTDPSASPFWGDPTGLPPSLFIVGSTEVMFDDSARMVVRGKEAGSDFSLVVFERAPHVFPLNRKLPEARHAKDLIVEKIRTYLPSST